LDETTREKSETIYREHSSFLLYFFFSIFSQHFPVIIVAFAFAAVCACVPLRLIVAAALARLTRTVVRFASNISVNQLIN
jgi:hypothetical protein